MFVRLCAGTVLLGSLHVLVCCADVQDELVVQAGDGRLTLQRGVITLSDVDLVLRLDGNDIPLSSMAPNVEKANPENDERERFRLTGAASGVELGVTVRVFESYALVSANVHRIDAASAPGPFVDGFALRGVAKGPTEPQGVLVNSYDGCALADIVQLQYKSGDEESFSLVGNGLDHERSDPRVSWWAGAISWDDSAVVSGALSVDTWKTRVLTYNDEGKISWNLIVGATGDKVVVGSTTKPTTFEEVFISLEPAVEGLARYGQLVAERMPPPAAPFVPVGWNSWNALFSDISHDKILEIARHLKTNSLGFPINNIQIDSGWAKNVGDWEPNPERFPHGIAALAQDISAEGFIPGLWFAPFLVSRNAPLATEHTDWLLKDEEGALVGFSFDFGQPTVYLIDPSHPGAHQFVMDSLRTILDAGFRYIKFDFGYAICVEGKLHDPNVTSIMACRKILADLLAMATEVGAFFVTSNAPLLPNAGMVHAFRSGDDIAFESMSYGFNLNKHAFRNVGIHFFTSPFLPTDPDTLMLRDLPPNVQRINATVSLMAGRIFNLGDNILTLDDERRAVLTRLAAIAPADRFTSKAPLLFRTIDLFDEVNEPADYKFLRLLDLEGHSAPSLWHQQLAADRDFLAVFNWNDEPKTRELDIAAIVDRAPAYIDDLWTGKPIAVGASKIGVTVEGRSVVVLDIR